MMDLESKKGPKKIAMLTAGGLAPCLSSCVASLIEKYTELFPETEIYCYLNGFRALPISDKIRVTPEILRSVDRMHLVGGSPIGNSRVSLDNAEDCYKRGLVPRGKNPWHVACETLVRDGIEVIHPIGGDGTSVGASRLSEYSHKLYDEYKLAVIGLPKTIDNDIIPISQSLGSHTAAKEASKFFQNVVGENTASNHVLLVHEIMGRHCGYLAAEAAKMYRESLCEFSDLTGMDYRRDIHALYIPEMTINFDFEVKRLRRIMKSIGCVNIFVSEGACLDIILERAKKNGKVEKDDSGNIKMSSINVGQWLADNIGAEIGSSKSLVVKSGYFSRAAASDDFDRDLIRKCCHVAVHEAAKMNSGVVGPNEKNGGKIELIPMSEIKGGKKFNIQQEWFQKLLKEIGQSSPKSNFARLTSIPQLWSKVDARNEGLFVKKSEINEENFEFTHSALTSASETENYNVGKIIESVKEKCNFSSNDVESLKEILTNLMYCFKFLSKEIMKAGAVGSEMDKKTFEDIAMVANSTIINSLSKIKAVKRVVTNTDEDCAVNTEIPSPTSYDIFVDALDGTHNMSANSSSGSIFGVYRHSPGALKNGSEQIMAGYCLFGAAVVLVISFKGAVMSLKLNRSQQHFQLINNEIKIPSKGDSYSTNSGYYSQWDEKTKKFVEYCKDTKKTLRHIGCMVADVHRTLLHGGIFFYPKNAKFPSGKISLMTEANPISFLVENAGGMATTGTKAICEVEPDSHAMKTPIFVGSKDIVNEVVRMYS